MPLSKISAKLRDEFDRVVREPQAELHPEEIKLTGSRQMKATGGVIVDGEDGCATKFARCCNPLPGDNIIGFITRGYGVSIHKIDCPNVLRGQADPEQRDRFINAHWEYGSAEEGAGGLYESLITVVAENSISLLAEITAALADMKVSLLGINTQKKGSDMMIVNLTIGCKNIGHYNSIVSRLKSVRSVVSVSRGVGR